MFRYGRACKISSVRVDAKRRTGVFRLDKKKGTGTALVSNQGIKGPIFPEGPAKSLKGGQLLAAQFNQKIKHRELSRPLQPVYIYIYRGRPEIATGCLIPRLAVISKTCFRKLAPSRRTNHVSTVGIPSEGTERKIPRGARLSSYT